MYSDGQYKYARRLSVDNSHTEIIAYKLHKTPNKIQSLQSKVH